MSFDIHQLDDLDPGQDDAAIETYRDTLIDLFRASPEGRERAQADPNLGHWAYQFMHFGYDYLGLTLPQIDEGDAAEIVTALFPRKMSLLSPDDADDTMPELIAFWEYLRRAFQLPNAGPILRFLRDVEPEFKALMNDPANFGMAKSFFMQGQAAGFDMTTQEGLDAFMVAHNLALMAGTSDPFASPSDQDAEPPARKPRPSRKSKNKQAKKQARKQRRKRKRKKRR